MIKDLSSAVKAALYDLYYFLIPRFIEERVAVIDLGQGKWEVVCREDELTDEDEYTCLGTSRCFTIFWIALFAKVELDNQ